MTIRVLSRVNSNKALCNWASVLGSIFEVASSKHIIYESLKNILKKLMICFSPFERFFPSSSIINSNLFFFSLVYKVSSCSLSRFSWFYFIMEYIVWFGIWSLGSKLSFRVPLNRNPNYGMMLYIFKFMNRFQKMKITNFFLSSLRV